MPMHGGHMGKDTKPKPKPVVIAHLRLDSSLAIPPKPVKGIAADPMKEAGLAGERRRIKEINAYLGSHEYALSHARLSGSPMALLIERGSAKGEEFHAAQEIELAFQAISGALMFKPLSMERTGRGVRQDWPKQTADAVQQYQAWATHWSARRKSHLDHTLECVVSAVIDQRPIRTIAADLGFDFRKIERAVLGGLRDYAARAGWVDGKIARAWMDAAELTFKRRAAA